MALRDRNDSGKPSLAVFGKSRARRWGEYLLAILGGNILFLLLEPHLPAALRHETFRVDWGLGLDFALCASLYGMIWFAGHAW
ncbi:MAG TPA: hypothetical protein VKE24_06845 [Candidatus Acidoferrales bacterium]|nr:hypothetical protein [Candidatus Acidoferrales bacterium]